MAAKDSAAKRPPLVDPAHVMTVWTTELSSIDVQGPITVLTFAVLMRDGPAGPERRVCSRIALPTSQISQIATRIEDLKSQAAALSHPEGNA